MLANFLARAARPARAARAARAAHGLQHCLVLMQEAPTSSSAHQFQKLKKTCKPSGTEARIAKKSLGNFLARASRPARCARCTACSIACSSSKKPLRRARHTIFKNLKIASKPSGTEAQIAEKVWKDNFLARAARPARAARAAHRLQHRSVLKPEAPTSSSAHHLQNSKKLANLRGRRRELLKKVWRENF